MQSDVFPYRANRVVFVLANLAFVASWLSLCVHLIRRCFNDEMRRPSEAWTGSPCEFGNR